VYKGEVLRTISKQRIHLCGGLYHVMSLQQYDNEQNPSSYSLEASEAGVRIRAETAQRLVAASNQVTEVLVAFP